MITTLSPIVLAHGCLPSCETPPIQWLSTVVFFKIILYKNLQTLDQVTRGLFFLLTIFAVLDDHQISSMCTFNNSLKL